MKKLLLILLALLVIKANAQIYKSTESMVSFFSETPLENINATNKASVSVLNINTGEIVFKVPIASFSFKDATMQEHFNENYMESDKYPSAVLDMAIVENIDLTKDGAYDITLHGTVDMHGTKQARDIKGKLIIKNGVPVQATAAFDVKLADHGIKIPKAVTMNIAEIIKVDVDFALEKYQKK